jgi:hypothetical protein
MKKITFLISLLAYGALLLGQSSLSPVQNDQSKSFRAIRVIEDQITSTNVAVEFWDSTTNKLLKRIDLVINSPFYNLKGRKNGVDKVLNTPRYVVPFKILKTDPLFMLTDEEMGRFNSKADSVGVRLFSSVTGVNNRPNDIIGIMYVMKVEGERSELAASRLALAVYDKRGNLTYEHQGIANNGGIGFLLYGGRYFCYTSFEDYDKGVNAKIPPAYTIFDMKEKKIVFREYFDGNNLMYGINQYFFVTRRVKEVEKNKLLAELSIYDIEEGIKYYKEFNADDLGCIEKADKKGVIIQSVKSGKTTALKFEKDFTETKVNFQSTDLVSDIVYIKPPQIEIDNIRIEALSNCTYKLMADVSSSKQKIIAVASGQYIFEDFQYEWTAYDYNNLEVAIEGLLDNPNAKEPMLNLNHPYIQNYEEGVNVSFLVRLRVTDSTGKVRTDGTSVHANIFRIVAKDNYKRCPGNSSYLERFPLVTGGGNHNIEFTWSVVSPAGGSLNFESEDNHDPNPYIFTPDTGILTYNLVVKILDSNGLVLCQRSKDITIEPTPLTLNMPSTVKVCAGCEQFIGPDEPFLLGGSGVYGFVWTTLNPDDMNRLASPFIGRMLIKDVPIGQTVPYTLYVGDIMSGCQASATVEVTGY